MNAALLRTALSFCGAWFLLLPLDGFSQIVLTSAQATNVSGMCYVTLQYSQPSQSCCTAVFSTPVTRNGQTLSTTLQYSSLPNCIPVPECSAPVLSTTLVLGQLEAGTYFLNMANVNFTPVSHSISFPIVGPADNTPMLSLTPTNGNLFALNVNGVPFVRYVVQASTDATNWTNIRTNTGAPFSMNVSPTNDATFYRTLLYSSH